MNHRRWVTALLFTGFVTGLPATSIAASASETLAHAVSDAARPEADRARDADRKPQELIALTGLHAGNKIAEILPGGADWQVVRADGAVSLGDTVGSIHRVGAVAQGLDACNGWTFWHIETPKGLRLIDELRAQMRAEMSEAAE